MNKAKANSILRWPAFPSLVLCVVFFIVNAAVSDGFTKSYIQLGFFSINVSLVCVAVGTAAVIICGGMDISLGSVVCLVNVLLAKMNEFNVPFAMQVLIVLLAALAMGLVNGLVIGLMRVTPLLATFATSTIYGGIALWMFPTPSGTIHQKFCAWYNSFLFKIIPVPILFVVIALVAWFLFMKTPMKFYLYTTGRHPLKAYISGIPVGKVQVFAYTFAGVMAGLGGIAMSGSTQGGDALVGVSISMNAIAACVIGGISLMGGVGSVIGAVFGALFLSYTTYVVAALKVPSLYQSLVNGIILLAGVMLSILVERQLQKEKKPKEAAVKAAGEEGGAA